MINLHNQLFLTPHAQLADIYIAMTWYKYFRRHFSLFIDYTFR